MASEQFRLLRTWPLHRYQHHVASDDGDLALRSAFAARDSRQHPFTAFEIATPGVKYCQREVKDAV